MGAASSGGRVNRRIGAVRQLAWYLSAGHAGSCRERARRVGRDDCGIGSHLVCISIYERGVYVVRDDWGDRHVCCRLDGEPNLTAVEARRFARLRVKAGIIERKTV